MAHRVRDYAPGVHHVTVGATGPSDYFRDHVDRLDWLRRFIRIGEGRGWKCLIVCQMTTHVHVLIDVPDLSLPGGMHRLNTGYGKEFNGRHDRKGGLVRRRYWSKRMRSEPQLVAAYRYIALNPVRAGICERAEEWYWSSFATSCELATTFPFVDARRVMAALDVPPGDGPRALVNLTRDGERSHVR